MRERVRLGDIAIDATLGNGHDTLFLCRLVGCNGHVYGFDIQADAIASTRERLTAAGIPDAAYTLLHRDHAQLQAALTDPSQLALPAARIRGQVAAVMFNLGYLPGGEHRLVTRPDTTIAALDAALQLIRVGGIVTAVVYPGHAGGAEEANAVETWSGALSQEHFQTISYRLLNQRNDPPRVIAIERRKDDRDERGSEALSSTIST